jgi:pimeloyl-ACP methyl ester carboxylesterase
MKLIVVLAAAFGAILVTSTFVPVSALAAESDLNSCNTVSGLQLAPALGKNPDLDGSGKPITMSASKSLNGKYIPVLMVHGESSSSEHSDARTGAFSALVDLGPTQLTAGTASSSMIGDLQAIPGAAVFTFDYHGASTSWVTDQRIAANLAKAIDCLFVMTGKKAIVVAQSTGGLAVRYALSQPAGGKTKREDEVSTVLTFGTPENGTLGGSAELGDSGANEKQSNTVRTLEALCGAQKSAAATRPLGTICGALGLYSRGSTSTIESALAPGSRKLVALPAWPKAVKVLSLEGDIELSIASTGWFFASMSAEPISLGDLHAGVDSVRANSTSLATVTCAYDLWNYWQGRSAWRNTCYRSEPLSVDQPHQVYDSCRRGDGRGQGRDRQAVAGIQSSQPRAFHDAGFCQTRD